MSTITTYYRGNMFFESQCGTHRVGIDVPPAMGGSDRGPKPPELFIASLGSCIAAFVANYCNQHQIDATGLSVSISFEKAERPGRLTNMRAIINLPHATLNGREQALRRVAEHCIIHETLNAFEGLEMTLTTQPRDAVEEEEEAMLSPV